MICKRLKKVLLDLIDLNQGAFVKGRSILHNVLLTQELLKGYEQAGISPRCVLKVDLQKAYETVSWKFLLAYWMH